MAGRQRIADHVGLEPAGRNGRPTASHSISVSVCYAPRSRLRLFAGANGKNGAIAEVSNPDSVDLNGHQELSVKFLKSGGSTKVAGSISIAAPVAKNAACERRF